jgi:cyclopropane-fatty-acyl-phospholipid synthase
MGLHHGETLRRWRRNLVDARDALDALGLDERFVRLWGFYFSHCEAAFEERHVRDVQLLYTAPAWHPQALRTAPNTEVVHHGREADLVRT